MKVFAKKELRQARMKHGFSLRALAQASGVAHVNLCHIENGSALTPTTAQKICAALGANFDDIFELKEG